MATNAHKLRRIVTLENMVNRKLAHGDKSGAQWAKDRIKAIRKEIDGGK